MNIKRYIDIAIRREIRRYADDAFTQIKSQVKRCYKMAQEVLWAIDNENGGDDYRPSEIKLVESLADILDEMGVISRSDSEGISANKQRVSKNISNLMVKLNRSIPSIKSTFPQYVQRATSISNILKDIQSRVLSL